MRSGFLILLIPLILSGNHLQSQSGVSDSEIRKAFLDLDVREGNKLLSQRYTVNDPGWIRLAGFRDFLGILLHQSKAGSDMYFRNSVSWLKILEKYNQEGSYGAGTVEIHLYRAVLASQFSDYKTAARELIASNRALARCGTEISTYDRDKLSGVLGVIFRQIPQQYSRYLKVAGIHPSGLSGFNGLERCYAASAPGTGNRLESYLLLVTALKEFGRDPAAAWKFIIQEGKPMVDNPLVRYQCALAARKAGEGGQSAELLSRQPGISDEYPFPYWLYQVARVKLYANEPDAGLFFRKFLTDPGGDNYRHSATLMAAWHCIITGQDAQAARLLEDVRNLPAPMTPYDKEALTEATTGRLSEPGLLQARLLFDGGNYRECLNKCSELEQSGKYRDDRQQAEICYRRARCEQRLGRDGAALACYLRVTAMAGRLDTYMLPNSALQAGHLYKKAGQIDLARKYYQMCLDLNHFGYREGISREAQTSLKELDN